MLALAVSTQVTLGHGGREDLMFGKPLAVPAVATGLALTVITRALMEVDPRRFFVWMAVASALFLGSTLVWGAFLVPKIVARVR